MNYKVFFHWKTIASICPGGEEISAKNLIYVGSFLFNYDAPLAEEELQKV